MSENPKVIVAGHLCLDVIPTFNNNANGHAGLSPGSLINIGKAVTSTGGTVSNTGLALHRLGIPVRLIGKIGTDIFGSEILRLLNQHGDTHTKNIIRSDEATTSYTIVLSQPGVDRSFLHYPGDNDTFSSRDIEEEDFDGAKLFHFGYPPLMKNIYLNHGDELKKLFKRARNKGLTTSLDMAAISPGSDSSKVNWEKWLENVLPEVDLFMPSLDEMLDALGKSEYKDEKDTQFISKLANQFLDMGVGIVVFKLGSDGLYVKTSPNHARLSTLLNCILDDNWVNREILSPCFKADVVGTTGSGDSTIAGFLSGLVKGLSIENTMKCAVGVGAFNVEKVDSLSGIPDWEELQDRINNQWPTIETKYILTTWNEKNSLWFSPHDGSVQL